MIEMGRAIVWAACYEIMRRSWREASLVDGKLYANVSYGFSGSSRQSIKRLSDAVRMAKRDLQFKHTIIVE